MNYRTFPQYIGTSLIILLFTQAAIANNTQDLRQSVSGLTLTLINGDTHCSLRHSKKDETISLTPLLLESPCFWVQSAKSSLPVQHHYPNLKAGTIVMIAGTELDWSNEKKEYQKLSTETVCTQYLQGIVIANHEVFAVGEKMDAPHCPDLSVDEKAFYQAASEEKRYQKAAEISTAETEKTTPNMNDDTPTDSLLESLQKNIKRLFSSSD